MKRILVTAFSETGNTAKVAQAIRDELSEAGHSVDLTALEAIDPNALSAYDVAFIGSTCHSSNLAAPVLSLLGNLPENSKLKLAGFMTHSTWGPSDDSRRQALHERWAGLAEPAFHAACAEKGIEFLGYFSCMGAPNSGIEEFIRTTVITGEDDWNEYIEEVHNHPSDQDLADARAFARVAVRQLP